MQYLMYLAGLVAGLAILVWSAGLFVGCAAKLARRCGISPLLVGMFIVGFGTSLPEMSVSFFSALKGNPSIALGNAYGSNIANILLILGLTAALRPIAVARSVQRRDLPVLCAATLLSWLTIFDGEISRLDAFAMFATFAAICWWNTRSDNAPREDGTDVNEIGSPWRLAPGIILGLALVVGSSMLLVKSAVGLAKALGVPDLIVGLTIVAIGTSLPELASSIAAIAKREHDIALGNIVGSNLFNLLAVVGIAAATRPIAGLEGSPLMQTVLRRDYPAMAAATLLLYAFCLSRRGAGARIGRAKGIVFLVLYVGYSLLLAKEALA